jgi:hypothetical protein
MPRKRNVESSTALVETASANPTSLREKFRAIEAESLRAWRQLAADMAAGGRAPNPEEVLRLATILGIDDPARALEQDAQVLREDEGYQRRNDRERAWAAEKLQPWNGDRARLLAELRDTEARVAELKQTIIQTSTPGTYWGSIQYRNRIKNPRLFDSKKEASS